jgi:hypothetical protein
LGGAYAQAFAVNQATKIYNFSDPLHIRGRVINPSTSHETKKHNNLWGVQAVQWDRVQHSVEERLKHYDAEHQRNGQQQLARAKKLHRGGMIATTLGLLAAKIGIILGIKSL